MQDINRIRRNFPEELTLISRTDSAPKTLTAGDHTGYIAECGLFGFNAKSDEATFHTVNYQIRSICAKYNLYSDKITNQRVRIYSKNEKPGGLLLALKEIEKALSSSAQIGFGAAVSFKRFTYPITEMPATVAAGYITADAETRRLNGERDLAKGTFEDSGKLLEIKLEELAEALAPRVVLEMPDLDFLLNHLSKGAKHKGINIVGAPGIGKSTITLAAINRLREDGNKVIVISCSGIDTEDGQEMRRTAADMLKIEGDSAKIQTLRSRAEEFLNEQTTFPTLAAAWNEAYLELTSDPNTIVIKLTDDLTRIGTIAHEQRSDLNCDFDIATMRTTEFDFSQRAQARKTKDYIEIGVTGVQLATRHKSGLRPTHNLAEFIADQIGNVACQVDMAVISKLVLLFGEINEPQLAIAERNYAAAINPLALQRLLQRAIGLGAIAITDGKVVLEEDIWSGQKDNIKAAASLSEITTAQMTQLGEEIGADYLLMATWLVGMSFEEIRTTIVHRDNLNFVRALLQLKEKGVIEYGEDIPFSFNPYWQKAATDYQTGALNGYQSSVLSRINATVKAKHPLLGFHIARHQGVVGEKSTHAAASCKSLYEKGEFAQTIKVAEMTGDHINQELNFYHQAALLATAQDFKGQMSALETLRNIKDPKLTNQIGNVIEPALCGMLFIYDKVDSPEQQALHTFGTQFGGRTYGLEVRLMNAIKATEVTDLSTLIAELRAKTSPSISELTILVRAANSLANKNNDLSLFNTVIRAAHQALEMLAAKTNIPARASWMAHLVAKTKVAKIRSTLNPGENIEQIFAEAEEGARKLKAISGLDQDTAMGLKAQIWIQGLETALKKANIDVTATATLATRYLAGQHEVIKNATLSPQNLNHLMYRFNYLEALFKANSHNTDGEISLADYLPKGQTRDTADAAQSSINASVSQIEENKYKDYLDKLSSELNLLLSDINACTAKIEKESRTKQAMQAATKNLIEQVSQALKS